MDVDIVIEKALKWFALAGFSLNYLEPIQMAFFNMCDYKY